MKNKIIVNKMDLENLLGYVHTLLDFIDVDDFEDEKNVDLVNGGYDNFVKPIMDRMNDITFTAFVYEDDPIIAADMSTYDSKEEAIEFAKMHNWDEVVNDDTGEVVWRR